MSFGPGADGGRDGYFVGTAPYPSISEQWSGRWYIQSKFLRPTLGKNPHEWLVAEIANELGEFALEHRRQWPDIWIIATNIDPSGVPCTGAFDKAVELVRKARPSLADRFAIWGGKKILDFLTEYRGIAERYGHFLTPGNVLARLISTLDGQAATPQKIIRHIIVDSLQAESRARLEQAGDASGRPDLHRLFVDVPFIESGSSHLRNVLAEAAYASAEHFAAIDGRGDTAEWLAWGRDARRAQAWLVLAGPGTGKTTLGQFLCQIHRAALLLNNPEQCNDTEIIALAQSIKERAEELSAWPAIPRIPFRIDLSQYATWYGRRGDESPHGLISFIAHRLTVTLEEPVNVSALRAAIDGGRWLIACDGLDEVPGDVKDAVSREILSFFASARSRCDLFLLCTSRPQGYSGQLKDLLAADVQLSPLPENLALETAARLLDIYAPGDEAQKGKETLATAIQSSAIQQLMTTPLQVHIMTIIVRQGQHPPEKKWELFRTFYDVIYRRESTKPLADAPEAALLREERKLIFAVHKALGFVLHARAETSSGSVSSLPRSQFAELVRFLVEQWKDSAIESTCRAVEAASMDRLVLINTPESRDLVRYDVRQLQEYFAAEFISEGVTADVFRTRLRTIAHSSHWREVLHFALSSIVEQDRETELAVVIDVLTGMNETSLYGDTSIIGRMLLSGSIAAAALLADGVLEPDRRVRSRFRGLIRQLGSAREAFQISQLLSVKAMESRNWLLDVMREHLRESTEEAAIGASVVLFCLSDSDWPDIIERWANWRPANRRAAFQVIGSHLSSAYEPRKSYALLNDKRIGVEVVIQIFYHFGRSSSFWIDAARASPDHAALLIEVMQIDETLRTSSTHKQDFGWFGITQEGDTPQPSPEIIAKATKLLEAGCAGYFGFVLSQIVFLGTHSRNAYCDVLRHIGNERLMEAFRPRVVNGFRIFSIPDEVSVSAAIDVIANMSDDRFKKALADGDFGLWQNDRSIEFHSWKMEAMPSCGPEEASRHLEQLVSDHPNTLRLVLALSSSALSLGVHVAAVKELLEKNPRYYWSHPKVWCALDEYFQGRFRNMLLNSGAELKLSFPWDRGKCRAMLLQLPQEAPLLCPVAGSLVAQLMNPREAEGVSKVVKGVVAEATRWVERVEDLETVVGSDAPAEIRSAAAILGALHFEGGLDFIEKNIDAIWEATLTASPLAGVAMVWALDAVGGLMRERCRALVEAIIKNAGGYGLENYLETLFSRSLDNVTRMGAIAKWLNSEKGPHWLIEDLDLDRRNSLE